MISQKKINKTLKEKFGVAKEPTNSEEAFRAGVEWALKEIKKQKEDQRKLGSSATNKVADTIIETQIGKATNVERFEVIDHTKDFKGRCYVKRNCIVELCLQDNGRTLKVFVNDRP